MELETYVGKGEAAKAFDYAPATIKDPVDTEEIVHVAYGEPHPHDDSCEEPRCDAEEPVSFDKEEDGAPREDASSESEDVEEPVEISDAPCSPEGVSPEESLGESVGDAAAGEGEIQVQQDALDGPAEETDDPETQASLKREAIDESAGGKEEVDHLVEEVIKPGKQSVFQKFKTEIDKIRGELQPSVESLPLDESQKAEIERRIEGFRSATTIVSGGSAKEPKTKELNEDLRTLLFPAVELVVPVGVHLGRHDKLRIVEVGRILDPIHKAISSAKLGIWRGFCELCGVSHTQMYKYVNLFRSFGESLAEFHEFTLTELEQFKNLKDKAAQHVRDNLDELRRVRGDLEAVKKIAGKRPTERRPSKRPWVKPIQYEGCVIRVNTRTGKIEGEHFFGKFDDLEKAVIQVLKKAKPFQKPIDEHGNSIDADEKGDSYGLLPSGWPSLGNTELDIGETDLRTTRRYASGVPSSCTVRIIQADENGNEEMAVVDVRPADVPLNSRDADTFTRRLLGTHQGTRSFALYDSDRFLMGYRSLPNNRWEIRWGIFN